MEKWKFMRNFAKDLISESRKHKENPPERKIIGERIIILHLDHATELLMKAFLIKKGYVISYVTEGRLKKGVKGKEVADFSKTLDYVGCLDLVCGKGGITLEQVKKDQILRFHSIRNEIQHRALNLVLDKGEEINSFFPILQELYEKMFPDFSVSFPIFDF